MAGKVKDVRVLSFQKCPRCARHLERLELGGDERETVVAVVCLNCGFELSERIERKRNVGGA